MYTHSRITSTRFAPICLALTAFSVLPTASHAYEFAGWWKGSTAAVSEKGCHQNALKSMSNLGFDQTKAGGFYVEGSRSGVTVVVTCTAGKNPRKVSFVLLGWADANVDSSVVEQVFKKMGSYVLFD
jgi:hypothetical protein